MTARPLDEARLSAFVGKAVGDCGALLSSALVLIGDKLGLYRAMAGAGPLTSAELAARTGTTERYVRDWLVNQAAGGYLDYHPATGRFTLPDEHAAALVDETSPYFLAGGFQASVALIKAEAQIAEAFRTGQGMLWGQHDPDLFPGAERFWRAGYIANLVSAWLPALDGVVEKLERGATVADIGCGHGASTILMAQAFPNSRFFGFDNHAPSMEHASRAAADAGVADRIRFAVADAGNFPGEGYDLLTYFDCLHDLGDPVGAMRHAREVIAPGGTAMVVEPMAGERVEENLNPVGRVFSAFSVLCCAPNAIAACACGTALGTIATDQDLRRVVLAGGFSYFRRATETPINRIFEARP
jgi:SAM-dependent methyltransferase